MVIFQSLGPSSVFVSERKAKAEIKKIERANQAIRDAVLTKVAASAQPTLEEKREEALAEVQNENDVFADAINAKLGELLRRSHP